MDVLEGLKSIIDGGGHYLYVLNNINSYLLEGSYAKYSAFYFERCGNEYLINSVGSMGNVSDEIYSDIYRIELFKRSGAPLGHWLVMSDYPREVFEEIGSLLTASIFFDEWESSYSFTQNRGCEFFPCHIVEDENSFSCLFCYCPLYLIPDCGGKFSILRNGMKDCTDCTLPHKKENYGYILSKLSSQFGK